MLIAAGVTCYTILVLVHALTALVSIFGLVADRTTNQENIGVMSPFMPAGGIDILTEQSELLASRSLPLGDIEVMVRPAIAAGLLNRK